jgi:hypothetical protein
MNAVNIDGLVDEDSAKLSKKKQEVLDLWPALNLVDDTAKIMDSFIGGINTGKHWYGAFLRDYFHLDC